MHADVAFYSQDQRLIEPMLRILHVIAKKERLLDVKKTPKELMGQFTYQHRAIGKPTCMKALSTISRNLRSPHVKREVNFAGIEDL